MPPLDIAVDVTPILDGGACGGAKPFVLDLLTRLARAGPHRYRLLTAPNNHASFAHYESLGVTRQVVNDPSSASLGAQRIDLLFCPMTSPAYAEAGVPTVCTLYDLQHLAYPWFFSDSELTHRAQFYRALVARASHVVCISEFSRTSLLRHFDIPPARTTTVPIAIHERLPVVAANAAWTRLEPRGMARCRFAFYPANLWPHKNHALLLLAFARYLRTHPESPLHLVLTGELLERGPALRDAVVGMGLEGRVHLLGFVSDEEMSALWSVAELLVFPSLYEGFGIPLLEAMHFGTPVICSREGSLPEVGGDDVWYIDARDPETIVHALHLARSDPAPFAARASAARRRLAAEDPMEGVRRYIAVFEAVAAAHPRRPPTAFEQWQGRIDPVRTRLVHDRRTRALELLRTGRAAMRDGHVVAGGCRAVGGALLGPEVALTKLLPLARNGVTSMLRRPRIVDRWTARKETRPWLETTDPHADRWVGPILCVDLDILGPVDLLTLDAEGPPGPLPRPLHLKAFLDDRFLGVVAPQPLSAFTVSWRLPAVAPGRHRVRIEANGFAVPDRLLANRDYRPLSYRMIACRVERLP